MVIRIAQLHLPRTFYLTQSEPLFSSHRALDNFFAHTVRVPLPLIRIHSFLPSLVPVSYTHLLAVKKEKKEISDISLHLLYG